ncbi:hypothetical protein V5O48_008649 [Marasmius crinis-equi]|uniref:SUN domain-containing protein n=1 Tax=Marasmius crinis-equi TaxID=585013 RepID=A0ABR3FDB3_9AGAR
MPRLNAGRFAPSTPQSSDVLDDGNAGVTASGTEIFPRVGHPETSPTHAQPSRSHSHRQHQATGSLLIRIIPWIGAFFGVISCTTYLLDILSLAANMNSLNRSIILSRTTCAAQNVVCTVQAVLSPGTPCSLIPCDIFRSQEFDGLSSVSTFLEVDYALKANGGDIIPTFTSETLGYAEASIPYWDRILYPVRRYYPQHLGITPPDEIIEDAVQIGQCWMFSGSKGHIGIALSKPIIITHITFHHPDRRELSHEALSQLPSQMQLWSLLSDRSAALLDPSKHPVFPVERFITRSGRHPSGDLIRLANLTYESHPGRRNTVSLAPTGITSAAIILEITANEGADRTCLYRISVHGISQTF